MDNLNQEIKAPEVLVLLLQSEEKCLLERLMEMCKPIVYSAINTIYLEGYETEDLLQEGRIVLAKAAEEYQFNRNMEFLNYYQMMLMNHLHKLLRKQDAQARKANKNAYSLDELMETTGKTYGGLATPDTCPEEAMIVKESYSQYVCNLSDLETVVYAGYVQGNSLKHTAKSLGMTLEQVRNALYRCKRKLNNKLS